MGKERFFQKSKENDFFFAWLFTRRLSGPIAIWLRKSPITPNQITFASILVGLLSFSFLFKGDPLNDFIGILLYQFCFLLDCIDGDLARLRNPKVKYSGIFFDYFRASILEPFLPIFFAVGLFNHGYPISFVIVIMLVSIWRWMPQYSREHIVIRTLDRDPEFIIKLRISNLLKDSPKKFNPSPLKKLLNILIKFSIIIWGLPIGMMNFMTVLAFCGLTFIPINYYLKVKYLYILIVGFLYFLLFLKSSFYEFNQLRKLN